MSLIARLVVIGRRWMLGVLSSQMPPDRLGDAADKRIEGLGTCPAVVVGRRLGLRLVIAPLHGASLPRAPIARFTQEGFTRKAGRSDEHTPELQSLMRNSYAHFCLTQNIIHQKTQNKE